jgi:DNA-binding MarR family transcriptional regulator
MIGMSSGRLANDAWEALFRAQVALMRRFASDDVWTEVTQVEYDVLYTLSKVSEGMSMVQLNHDILMTQSGVSKLVGRLESRGLITREVDSRDRRATRITLTAGGRAMQRHVGGRHAATVTAAMTNALDAAELARVRDLCAKITDATDFAPENLA